MIRNLLFTFGIFLFASVVAMGQPGTLKGKVLDKDTKEPLPFVAVVLENGGTVVGSTTSDFDGLYVIKPIPPGTYDLKASSVGYKPIMIQGMVIKAGAIEFYDISMSSTKVELTEVEVVEYKVPLIQKDKTQTGATVTKEDISKMPNRNANAIATTVGGVFSQDGERGSVRGARSEETVTYIDGVKVIGSANLPASALEQVSVVLGGTPAMYGDVTGGVISITTRGPSRQFNGGLELRTSKFLDAYGHNAAEFNLTGPLFRGKNKNSATSLLGFFMAGNVTYNESTYHSPTGINRAKDAFLDRMRSNPVVQSQQAGTFGVNPMASYITSNDIENVKAAQYNDGLSASMTTKIDVKTSKNTNLTLGGSFNYNKGRNFSYGRSMFNAENNSLSTGYTWRTYAKFTQRFPTDKESNSVIKNFFYSIQADYTQTKSKTESHKFKDQLFKYGYLGKYETYKTPTFQYGYDTVTGANNVNVLNSWDYDTSVVFTAYEDNMALANYTNQFYEFYPETSYHRNLTAIQAGKGLLNGDQPFSVYGIWEALGVPYNGYGEYDKNRFGVNVAAALDIKSHEVKFGFQYEQEQSRYFGYSPVGFWTLMRNYTNAHIKELDVANPYLVYSDGVFHANETPSGIFMDTVMYYRKYDEGSQRTFDKNLRQRLGLAVDGTDFIDIDSYDIENNTVNVYDRDGKMTTMTLSEPLDVSMFSADELYRNGSSLVTAYGYDYKGNKLTGRQSFDDFFTKRDGNGDLLRNVGAYEPIYMAGYIQDKFDFNGDLVVNVGLRVDRFDANQLTLKDPYLFFPAKTAGELSATDYTALKATRPGNVGDDYVVYVDNIENPTAINGYRDGDTWYNAAGAVVDNPLTQVGDDVGVKPYLQNPSQSQAIQRSVFKDYDPQWTVMPRLSFSFPVSDEALFFAHYDILTQRPLGNNRFDPTQYMWYGGRAGSTYSNPDLKPKQTIDYELGFQQKLTNSSSLSIATYYKEIRNLVQFSRYVGAYPFSYYTFKNIDFGTIKGLTLTYDLRRTKNVRLRAAYTLQFAEGTGSSDGTSAALVREGKPNLRMLNPLSFDRRHAINLTLDYRYGVGKKYDGPTINRKDKSPLQIFANTGAALTVNGGSGTPYTRSANVINKFAGGTNVLTGTYFGSRLPWSFRMDLKIDKDFSFKLGDKKDARTAMMNVYLAINNVLNMKNILGVYSYTGSPDDDGFLASPEGQNLASSQLDADAYRLLYATWMTSPWNYSAPRTINLGVIFSF